MDYKLKYLRPLSNKHTPPRGPVAQRENWEGDRPIERDRYYAYLKHRAQAKFRGEEYLLTIEDWETLWPLDKWVQRGRHSEALCLTKRDTVQGWHVDNVEVVTRITMLQRERKPNKKD